MFGVSALDGLLRVRCWLMRYRELLCSSSTGIKPIIIAHSLLHPCYFHLHMTCNPYKCVCVLRVREQVWSQYGPLSFHNLHGLSSAFSSPLIFALTRSFFHSTLKCSYVFDPLFHGAPFAPCFTNTPDINTDPLTHIHTLLLVPQSHW